MSWPSTSRPAAFSARSWSYRTSTGRRSCYSTRPSGMKAGSGGCPLIDPASEEVEPILRPGTVARHRAGLERGEDPGGGVPDVVVGEEVEVRLHRVAVLLPEERPDIGREADGPTFTGRRHG